MNAFYMGRFNPSVENEPIEVRIIIADNADEACQMLDEPFDGSYWYPVETRFAAANVGKYDSY
jgi:hypothetical protein